MDGACLPHLAAVATNVSVLQSQPARNHRWQPLRRGRRHDVGTTMEPGLDAVLPTGRGLSTPNECGAH